MAISEEASSPGKFRKSLCFSAGGTGPGRTVEASGWNRAVFLFSRTPTLRSPGPRAGPCPPTAAPLAKPGPSDLAGGGGLRVPGSDLLVRIVTRFPCLSLRPRRCEFSGNPTRVGSQSPRSPSPTAWTLTSPCLPGVCRGQHTAQISGLRVGLGVPGLPLTSAAVWSAS